MSEKKLEQLIQTIKSEAIDSADKKAAIIIEKAKAEADRIVLDAEAKATQLVHEAETESKLRLAIGERALEQAARDLKVKVKHELILLLSGVLEKEVQKTFTPERIEKAVETIIEHVGKDLTVSLPDHLKDEVAKDIMTRLQQLPDLSNVIQDASILSGFSIAKTAEGWSYKISADEVAKYLSAQLSPKWVNIIKATSLEQ